MKLQTLLLLTLALGSTEAIGSSTHSDQYLSRLVPFGFSGAVLIAREGEVVLNQGYGLADDRSGRPNTSQTLFSLGSIVKPLTSLTVMSLIEDGKLSLDDRLGDRLPGVPRDKVGISLKQMLSHTSGMPGAVGPDTELISRPDYLARVWASDLEFPPGEGYEYSNVAFTLLALIVEDVTGVSYEQAIRKHVLLPAGMMHTGYRLADWDELEPASNYSRGTDNGSFLDREHYPTLHLIGNGGILTTTQDMFQFYLALRSASLIGPETFRTMTTPVFGEDALGWVNVDEGHLFEHNGASRDGNSAVMRWYPHDDVFVMIFANRTIGGREAIFSIQDPISGMAHGEQPALPPVAKRFKGNSRSIEGDFQVVGGDKFTLVRSDDGDVSLEGRGQSLQNQLQGVDEESAVAFAQHNQAIRRILSGFLESGDDSTVASIHPAPEELAASIEAELQGAGIDKATIRELRTVPAERYGPGARITRIWFGRSDGQRGSLTLALVFNADQVIGVGANFGPMPPIAMRFVPVSAEMMIGYDIRSGRSATLEWRDNDLLLQGQKVLSVPG